jgi:hypothetical protein
MVIDWDKVLDIALVAAAVAFIFTLFFGFSIFY